MSMTTETPAKVGEREVKERLARCVSTMVYYRTDGHSRAGSRLLRDEVGLLAAWADRSGLGDELATRILGPLERELVVRFGGADGRKLHREFLGAYRAAARPRAGRGQD